MFNTIKMNAGEWLICDPGYIKKVSYAGELRFDALRCVKVLHEGDDGIYEVITPYFSRYLGVDSGRIWVMRAEFDCEVEEDSGFSGYMKIPEKYSWEEFKIG